MKKEDFIKSFKKKYDEGRRDELLSRIKLQQDKIGRKNKETISKKRFITTLQHIPDIFFDMVPDENSFVLRYEFDYVRVYIKHTIELFIFKNFIDIRFHYDPQNRQLVIESNALNFSCPSIVTGVHKERFINTFNKYLWMTL